jgi:hypothetical protein
MRQEVDAMVTRRRFCLGLAGASLLATARAGLGAAWPASDPKNWLPVWKKNVLNNAVNRYCDKELGEEIGWLISPFLNAFYYGWLVTRNRQWIQMFVDWSDSWIKRHVMEPDGFVGWPKVGAAGTEVDHLNSFYADSLLGEAMALCPMVLMSIELLHDPALKAEYGAKAEGYLKLSGQIFEKWEQRGAWRELDEGKGIWIYLPFGIDSATGKWTANYEQRNALHLGFSYQDNKANEIACWHLAMHDATRRPVYKERAEHWFRLMKSRLTPRDHGRYFVWNYWQPAGPWDKKADGSPKHWIGVHPNGGYYSMDVEAITTAYEHQLVFTDEDIDRLIATNRDFMWNQQLAGAKFQCIDGGPADARWKKTPGVLWASLSPYDKTLSDIFLANNDPSSWSGITATPRFLARQNSVTKLNVKGSQP